MSRTKSLAASLALRDWLHDGTLSLCAVLALASMLAPILVLMGLKNGVLEAMRARLLEDPAILVITPKSDAGSFDRAFVNGLARLPGAAYAIGRTRATSTDATLTSAASPNGASIALEPASPGEPLLKSLGQAAPANGENPEIVLSSRAAAALFASPGQKLRLRAGRRSPQGRLEAVNLELTVSGVLPASAGDRKMAFVPLELLEDLESYRDYLAVPGRGWSGDKPPGTRSYASFRLYARDLDSVADLARQLSAMHIESLTRAREIFGVQTLAKSINKVILIISAAIGAGFVAFTVSTAQGAVARKHRMLGLMRLLGFSRASLLCYPLTQILASSLCGFALSCLIYAGVSGAIASAFAEQGLYCSLSPFELACTMVIVTLLGQLAGARAAWAASSVEPAEVVREN